MKEKNRSCEEIQRSIWESKGNLETLPKEHIDRCESCKLYLEDYLFLASHFSLNTFPEISNSTLEMMSCRAQLVLREKIKKAENKRLGLIMTLVAVLSFPLIFLINGLVGWTGYTLIGHILPQYFQTYFIITFSSMVLLGFSFLYGSLPIIYGYMKKEEELYVTRASI